MLRFSGITKAFGWRQVFHGIDDDLAPGVYALQGANGSGKSTLLGILSGAIAADSGDVWIDGVSLTADPLAARQRLSYAPDESPIYPFMGGRDLLDFVAMAKQAKVDSAMLDLAAQLGLSPYMQTRFGAMSLGTQKKFLLCAAWIGEPRAMLLDEPSNGLDTRARKLLAQRIRARGPQSLTLFASHDTSFVEACGATVLHMDRFTAHDPCTQALG
ncbi:ABC transporter, ATP-binding protein [Thiomonas sp. X19]|uniref:ABC transporter ATP-binding protein n=1 Tax=Thiomonas sp. X19 TaxID=1050370 RepID=UPI000B6B9D64|nr:ABC transporter ATP-binding protein [Thiomonas sp. X19]SCC94156.1 ABC transporter, ATP-binding protein [Thiomonas sp. X19]